MKRKPGLRRNARISSTMAWARSFPPTISVLKASSPLCTRLTVRVVRGNRRARTPVTWAPSSTSKLW